MGSNPGSNSGSNSDPQDAQAGWTERLLDRLRPVHTLRGHTQRICDLQWSPDGNLLASAARDRTIRLWNREYANLRAELTGHDSDVRSVSWCPDGRLISGSRDQSVRVWDQAAREVARFTHRAPIERVACSPTRPWVAAAMSDGRVSIRDLASDSEITCLSLGNRVRCVDWSADGTLLLAAAGSAVVCWSTDAWQTVQQFDLNAAVRSAAFVVEDRLVVVAGDRPNTVIFDRDQGVVVVQLEGHTTSVDYVCASPDRWTLATQSGADGETLVWDCDTWKRIGQFKTSRYRAPTSAFAFHPRPGLFATTSRSKNDAIQFWSHAAPPPSSQPSSAAPRCADRITPMNSDRPSAASPGDPAFDVFLSHNSVDKPVVREIGEALKGRGLTVWLDEWELVPGQPWQEALEKIVETTKAAAVLVGSDGIGPWQDREMRGCLSEFVGRGLPVIPVLLPDAPDKPKLPMFLTQFTWVDLRSGLNADGLDRIEWGITGVKPKPS